MFSNLKTSNYFSKEPISTWSYEGFVKRLQELNPEADLAVLKLFAIRDLMKIKDHSSGSKAKKAQSMLLSAINNQTEALPASSSNARPERSSSPTSNTYNVSTTIDARDNVIVGDVHVEGARVQLETSGIRKDSPSDDLDQPSTKKARIDIEDQKTRENEDSLTDAEASKNSESVNDQLAWQIEDVDLNISKECALYKENSIARAKLQELDDISILAMHSVYFFSEQLQRSITCRFEGTTVQHTAIISKLGLYEERPIPSSSATNWCTTAAMRSYNGFQDIQCTTIQILSQAVNSNSSLDSTIANILHRLLPTYKLDGFSHEVDKDTYVHDILSPFLDNVFSMDINFQYSWSNVTLDDEYDEFKPDYMAYPNGLSEKFVVLVAAFKPPQAHQGPESDFVKLGKEMRLMINQLLQCGVVDPVVCGIQAHRGYITTYKMELKNSKTYVMVELSSILFAEGSNAIHQIPLLASSLYQLKTLSLQTAEKVQKVFKQIQRGDSVTQSVPETWLDWTSGKLTGSNSQQVNKEEENRI